MKPEIAVLLEVTETGTPEERAEAARKLFAMPGGHFAFVDAVGASATAALVEAWIPRDRDLRPLPGLDPE